MSELKPSVYEYEPDFPPPVFEGAPLPIRKFQVLTTINDSLFMRSDTLPASFKNESIQDAVREIEEADESIDVKNARLIGLIAAMTEIGLEASTLPKWRLTPHLGMLNAIGAALSAGLIVSEASLRMATAFHQEYGGHDVTDSDDPYASPGADSAVLGIMHTMSNYAGMDIEGEKSIEKYVSYYMYDIDKTLYDLPVTLEMLASYEGDKEVQHMVALCDHIISKVNATRSAVIDREDELVAHLEQIYERIAKVQAEQEARIEAEGVQEALPGLEDIDDFYDFYLR